MTLYDQHCHVFNGSILRDVLPHPAAQLGKMLLGSPADHLDSWWTWLQELGSAVINSESENQEFLLQRMQANLQDLDDCDIEYCTVPLMMDIAFLFQHPMGYPGPVDPPNRVGISAALKNQIQALQALSRNQDCFPFLAVDPRRPELIEAVMAGEYVTVKPGGFYGIKLYPRLGYHPMAGRLPDLYRYCADQNIPITSHCSTGGFPNWNTPSGQFCDPEGFRVALQGNPSLRLNFAHFGNGSLQWGKSIVDLMTLYPNVYSDLSCYTGKSDLDSFKATFWDTPIVKQRTLYGSDYDIFYFVKISMDLDQYIQDFRAAFNNDEIIRMASTTPERFMGFPRSGKVVATF